MNTRDELQQRQKSSREEYPQTYSQRMGFWLGAVKTSERS